MRSTVGDEHIEEDGLRFGIDAPKALIQEENLWSRDKSTKDSDDLSLASGKLATSLANGGEPTSRIPIEKGPEAECFQMGQGFRWDSEIASQKHIVGQCASKKGDFLGDI
jgi:hypothetical protein